MGRKRTKRRQSHGSAWNWTQTDCEYLAHYHEERPHQSLANEPLVKHKKRGATKVKISARKIVR